MTSRLEYRADLDGLRAIAVIPVVLFHLGVTVLPGGFVGVDVFFVLSGFLITSLLAADLKRGTFSLLGFYDRRIRRIIPALTLVLVFCAGGALLILFPADLRWFGSTLTAAALSGSNFVFARHSGYFAPNTDLAPLLHTWSLAVEEQFYIFFPVLLWAVWLWARKWLTLIIWLTLVLSFTLSVWGVWIKPTPTFYLLPTRAWELLAGGVLALELVRKPMTTLQRELGAAVGVLAILTSMIFYTSDTSFPGAAALIPCIGAALVIWAGMGQSGKETWTGRLLASPIPVFIGLISYSLYLWHWPLIVYAKLLANGPLMPLQQLLLAFVAVAFAVLSWRYVEQPLRAGGWPWPKPHHRFLVTGFLVFAFALFGLGVKLGHGLPQRLSPPIRELAMKTEDFSRLRSRCHADGSGRWTFSQTCVLGASVPPKIIVFADSHGAELSVAIGEAAKARHLSVRQITASGCPPAVGFSTKHKPNCALHVDAMLHALLKTPPSTVVMVAYYFRWGRGSNGDNFWKGFSNTVQSLREAGHSVVLLGAVPPYPGAVSVPSALAKWVYHGGTAKDFRFALDRSAASNIEEHLKRIANKTGASYIPIVPYFCPDDLGCQGYKNGTVMYFDNNHMSVSGARQVATNLLEPVIWPKHLQHGFLSNR